MEFFVRHHFERVVSGGLMHVQPWWFYVPVFLGSLLPWSPLAALACRRESYREPRRLFLAAWVVFGFVLFSVATNKLPGYLLPLMPAAAALLGLALSEAPRASLWLGISAALLMGSLSPSPILPLAVGEGLSRAPRPSFQVSWLAPIVLLAAIVTLEKRGRRLAAVACLAGGAGAGIFCLKAAALPALDRAASARPLWLEVRDRAPQTCIGNVARRLAIRIELLLRHPASGLRRRSPSLANRSHRRRLAVCGGCRQPTVMGRSCYVRSVDPIRCRVVPSRFRNTPQ